MLNPKYCTNCFTPNSLYEEGFDIWEGGEEKQFICHTCGKMAGIVILWETGEVEYNGMWVRQSEMEYVKPDWSK
jgi:hypothetical protein